MDPYLHTAIATGMLFVSYQIGRYNGVKEGAFELWLGLLEVFNAKEIKINEDGEFLVTDKNGKEKKVN
jgi:hypothetical protein